MSIQPEPVPARRRGIEESPAAQRIIAAVERLLVDRPLHDIPVSDILKAARVARGTFYLWFTSKQEVVVEGHRQVMVGILDSAARFLEQPNVGRAEIRTAIEGFVATWRDHGPMLAASAEIWRSAPALSAEWSRTMQSLVDLVAARISGRGGEGADVDPQAVAHALIWMNERTLYMASAGLGPMPVGPGLVEALTHVWTRVLIPHQGG